MSWFVLKLNVVAGYIRAKIIKDKKIYLNKIKENSNHADFLHIQKYQILYNLFTVTLIIYENLYIHYIFKYLITLNLTLY